MFRAPLVSVLLLLSCISWAAAQSVPPETPLMGSETVQPVAGNTAVMPDASPITAFGGEDGIYRILVIGDSLAGGLGAGMSRMAVGDQRIEVANRFNEFASLLRPQNYDWPEAVAKITAVKPYDAVVVLMGINDRQDWRNGNILNPFGSPQWVAAYEQQLDRLLDSLNSQKLKIYWVALPPFGDAGFESAMQVLAPIQKRRVEAKGGVVIDVRQSMLATDGNYTDRGLDEFGVERRIRQSDGITFLKQGNNRFAILVLDALKAAEKDATPQSPSLVAGSKPEEQATLRPATSPDSGNPIFSGQGLDGNDVSFDAGAIVPQLPQVYAVEQGTPGQLTAFARPAAGSKSEMLVVRGAVSQAPAGRIDDFSYVEPSSSN